MGERERWLEGWGQRGGEVDRVGVEGVHNNSYGLALERKD